MKIHIGIVGRDVEGWKLLLEQEGVPFSCLDNKQRYGDYSLIIVSAASDENTIDDVKKYLLNGGAILCSGDFFSLLSGTNGKKTYVKYLLGNADSSFPGIELADIEISTHLPVNADNLQTNNHEPAVYCGRYGGGTIGVLPFNAGTNILDDRMAKKSFYSKEKKLPFELVSSVAKGTLRRLVSRLIERLHHERGIPYAHLWYFPNDSPTIFNWRIDTDYAGEKEIQDLYQLIHIHNIQASWFVDVKSQERILSFFRKMEGQEIGVHCYEHQTFDDYDSNHRNIGKALEVFNVNGLEGKSFAAPYGKWNDAIACAINDSGFEYSSEFSYDYDNMPSFPIVHGNELTLQIPVHPISIGSLRRQGYSPDMMKGYFDEIIKKKLLLHEPLFFYHHPKDRNDDVVQHIFNFIKKYHIANLRLIDYARWWKKRNAMLYQLNIEDDTVQIIGSRQMPDHLLHITRPDGTEAFSSMSPSINFQTLSWSKRTVILPPPDDIERIRKFNPWMIINRMEDYFFSLIRRRS